MKDNCVDHETLSAYADGELEGAAAQQVAAHLSMCADCAARMEELRQLQALFAPLREEWAPINVVDAVCARVVQEPACRWGWRQLAVVPFVLLSFASLLLGAKLGTQLMAPQQPSVAVSVRLAPFAAVPPGNLCIGHASCYSKGNI
jgi:anti-sigma factor RsiW